MIKGGRFFKLLPSVALLKGQIQPGELNFSDAVLLIIRIG